MRLADEIRILRQKSFLTQTQFAEELQVSFTTVNRWEKGKATPNLSTMKRIKAYCEKKWSALRTGRERLAWHYKGGMNSMSDKKRDFPTLWQPVVRDIRDIINAGRYSAYNAANSAMVFTY